nr:Gag-Pol polyprotein [Tanacetum cinerariifolium]
LQDKGIVISELKKLIEMMKGKSVDTKFEKSLVIRPSNAFKSQRPSVLGKPTTFSNSFVRKDFSKSKSVTQNNVLNDFSKPVTAQTLPPNKKSILKNKNVLAPGMYKLHTESNQTRTSQLPQDSRKTNKHVSFSTGLIPTTSVSRPQLKSNPMKIESCETILVEIFLFIVDSVCSKHMTGNIKLLINFVEKFLGTGELDRVTSSNTSRANQDNSLRINRSVGYENQRIGNGAGARETVGLTTMQKSRIQCYNCKEFGHVTRECQKLKRAKDAAYHREKMLLCKQEEAGIQLNADQADWRDDTDDDELEDQELEAYYMYMAQLQEVSPDAADSEPIFDDEPL